ncbi:MAG: hypothetical protein AEth_00009 [Candidatus Argoarchaeum ethanivorans]|uniref:Uncharacterized protein n=1 Tax=Candidatus Argoarchaeum ethanivorans TaxID=2608793 RepID=A0A8B3S7A7_9EURY|nr:MAG: hypothetical protein AEth_00009 [Candidatus Argoarchaeum ethanivorans]
MGTLGKLFGKKEEDVSTLLTPSELEEAVTRLKPGDEIVLMEVGPEGTHIFVRPKSTFLEGFVVLLLVIILMILIYYIFIK